jgi:hypothetical protein
MSECSRDAHLLARRARGNARAPAQPMCAAEESAIPPLALVEFVQSHQQTVRGRMQVRRKLGDLVAETLEIGLRIALLSNSASCCTE